MQLLPLRLLIRERDGQFTAEVSLLYLGLVSSNYLSVCGFATGGGGPDVAVIPCIVFAEIVFALDMTRSICPFSLNCSQLPTSFGC